MKRLTLLSLMLVVVAGFCVVPTVQGDSRQPGEMAPRIGLVDMAYVFDNYEKFAAMRETLKEEFQANESKAKGMVEQLKELQAELKNYKQGSKDYIDAESRMAQAKTRFDLFRANSQRDLVKKESELFKNIYLEVTGLVGKYANRYEYTMILRFNRAGLEDVEDPRQLIQKMNRQVIYHRPENDITDDILRVLNSAYSKRVKGGRTTNRPNNNRRQ